MTVNGSPRREKNMSKLVYMSVGEASRQMGVAPRVISDLFYARKLSIDRCPVVAGRRLIPNDYLPEIERVVLVSKQDDQSDESTCKSPDANQAQRVPA